MKFVVLCYWDEINYYNIKERKEYITFVSKVAKYKGKFFFI